MNKQQVNDALFAFLQAIYKFEQMELARFSISWQEMLLLKQLVNNNDFSIGYATQLLGIKAFQATRLVDGLVKKELLRRFEKSLIDESSHFRLPPKEKQCWQKLMIFTIRSLKKPA